LPLPDSSPGPYLLFTEGSTFMRSCTQDRQFDLRGYERDSSTRELVTVALLAPEPHYVAATGIGSAVVALALGPYIAPDCKAAQPINLPAGASGELQVRIAETIPAGAASEWFWRVVVGARSRVMVSPTAGASALTICPSCDQGGPDCFTVPISTTPVAFQAASPELVFHVSNPPDGYYLALRATFEAAPAGP